MQNDMGYEPVAGQSCPPLAQCTQRFEGLRSRMESSEKELVRLDGESRHTLRSLSSLIKAIWAVALSTFGVLLSFVVWYIQHLG